ncbi:MAG: L,D-transpeptidase [Hyphomicrobiaceae bacterium]
MNIAVRSLSARSTVGHVAFGTFTSRCALGRGGRRTRKREGDGSSPVGRWLMLAVYYRSDRMRRPRTLLPVRAIGQRDGWCDAPGDRNYNRPVWHPYPRSAEHLWRTDGVYDILVTLSHNVRPRVRGHGSAVFVHLAREDFAPTAGCLAVSEATLRKILERVRPGRAFVVF